MASTRLNVPGLDGRCAGGSRAAATLALGGADLASLAGGSPVASEFPLPAVQDVSVRQ